MQEQEPKAGDVVSLISSHEGGDVSEHEEEEEEEEGADEMPAPGDGLPNLLPGQRTRQWPEPAVPTMDEVVQGTIPSPASAACCKLWGLTFGGQCTWPARCSQVQARRAPPAPTAHRRCLQGDDVYAKPSAWAAWQGRKSHLIKRVSCSGG